MVNETRLHGLMVDRRSSLTNHEEDIFLRVFDGIVADLQTNPKFEEVAHTAEWMREILTYNVPHGKQIRGRSVVSTYRILVQDHNDKDLQLASILGWAVEMFQACYLLADDIMDGSEARRGQPCWHLIRNIGKSAINDAFILEGFIFHTLEKEFGRKPYYAHLIRLFHDMFIKTALGQCADTRNANEIYSNFSMNVYSKIVKYKTSYYTFYLPVAAAMIMAGITDQKMLGQAEEILLEIGFMFQVQDDYLDCYADPKLFGKVGNDIKENKCSWLIVKALELANKRQKTILKENYGRGKRSKPENISKVKEVFGELKLDREFTVFETLAYMRILSKISDVTSGFPGEVFKTILELIYTRRR